MALPETVLTLAGFALAHGAITASDLPSTQSLAPFAIVEQGGERRLVQFDAPSNAAGVKQSREALKEFARNADGWAFVRPGRMRQGVQESDVLIIEFKGKAMDKQATLLQRVHRVDAHHRHDRDHSQRHRRDDHDRDHDRDRDHHDQPATTPPTTGTTTPPVSTTPSDPATTTTTGSSSTTTATDPTTSTSRTTTTIQLTGSPALVTNNGTVADSGTVQNVSTTTQYPVAPVQQGVQLYPDGASLLANTTSAP